jgi:hypothetical protein
VRMFSPQPSMFEYKKEGRLIPYVSNPGAECGDG